MFQLSQVALEGRFQAWAEDYDTPEGRQTELADIGKIDKVPVYLIYAKQDGNCETPEGVKRIAEAIPSHKMTFELDPFTHNDFMAPTGEQGRKLLEHIKTSMDDIAASASTYLPAFSLAAAVIAAAFLN